MDELRDTEGEGEALLLRVALSEGVIETLAERLALRDLLALPLALALVLRVLLGEGEVLGETLGEDSRWQQAAVVSSVQSPPCTSSMPLSGG